MSEEFETPAEATGLDVEQSEESGGSQHFDVGDSPPGAEAIETEAVATEEVSDSGVEGAAQEPTSQPFWSFKTADGEEKTFTSRDEAQQFFSSWNGRLSKAERELRDVTDLNYQWQKAYESGSLGQPATPQGADLKEAAGAAAESGALSKSDWINVQNYIQAGKGETALQYIQWRNAEYLKEQVEGIRTEFKSEIEQLTAPQKFQREVHDALGYVAESQHAAVDDMGQPKYPEFQDGPNYDKNFVAHFREIWLDQDYRMAASPGGEGFEAAYYKAKATYKAAKPSSGQGSSSATIGSTVGSAVSAAATAASNRPRNPDGTFQARNQALAMSGSNMPSAGKPTGTGSKGGGILEAMRDVGTSRSKHFAVSPD